MKQKTHYTALAIVPPLDVWEPIQAIRKQHDRQFHRWMPHINLLYLFYPPDRFADIMPILGNVCRSISPFEIVLQNFRYFVHRSERCTVWLAPEPAEDVIHLQGQLYAACPECDELSRFPGGFVPHLSVGQAASPEAACQLLAGLAKTWRPLRFAVREVALLKRERRTPFDVILRIPLGEENYSVLSAPA